MDYGIFFKIRKSLRLKGYDYSQNGFYFVTISIKNNKNLLGKIDNGKLILNDAGLMVKKWYFETENKFKNIKCDNYVIMPNHVHFIIEIVYKDKSISLSRIIQWFKTMTTNEYIRNVKNNNWEPFESKLWLKSYYEDVIRNMYQYQNVYYYIKNNPKNWKKNKNNNVNEESKTGKHTSLPVP